MAALAAPAPKPRPRPQPVNRELLELQQELQRFPSADTCSAWLERADQHLLWLDTRILLFPADREDLTFYRQQVVEWRSVWSALRYAQTSSPYVTVAERWEQLAYVRDAIGLHAYALGFMPPPVAVHLLPTR